MGKDGIWPLVLGAMHGRTPDSCLDFLNRYRERASKSRPNQQRKRGGPIHDPLASIVILFLPSDRSATSPLINTKDKTKKQYVQRQYLAFK